MTNLKFDIKKLFNDWNQWRIDRNGFIRIPVYITREKLSEKIQLKAFELGCKWQGGTNKPILTDKRRLIIKDNIITWAIVKNTYENLELKEATLDFLNLKPTPQKNIDYVNEMLGYNHETLLTLYLQKRHELTKRERAIYIKYFEFFGKPVGFLEVIE